MKRLALAFIGLALAGSAAASGGPELHYAFQASTNPVALQRGARNYMNYCSGCHAMKHMRYSRIAQDLGIDEESLKANLMFTSDKTGDPIRSAMPAESAKWFGQPPPDLTLETRLRGDKWVYNYLLSFYVDPTRPLGVNNLVLPGASMPHVLWELQGWQTHDAPAAQGEGGHGEAAAEGHAKRHGPPLTLAVPGKLSPDEYKKFVSDTVSFMAYAAEPGRGMRMKVGTMVMLYLVVLTFLFYLLKKEYWRDVH